MSKRSRVLSLVLLTFILGGVFSFPLEARRIKDIKYPAVSLAYSPRNEKINRTDSITASLYSYPIAATNHPLSTGLWIEKMVQEGLFKKYPMDAIFGMHNWPGLEAGTIAIKSGPVMAAFDVFDIIIHGKGGHAAKPHLVKDPIVIAAQLISAIQSICSRETDPLHSVVVSITQIHAGENYNVIPQTVHMKGTVRSFSADVQASTEKSLQRMVDGICLANGVKGELNYQKKYPATINHDKETEFARQVAAEVVGKERLVLDKDPSMGSEDFSFMLNQCPGSYVWIGNGDGAALHNPNYNFNDNILSTGASYWVHLVEKYLKNSPAF